MSEEKETFRKTIYPRELFALDELYRNLCLSLGYPPLMRRHLVDELNGFKFEIFANEHPPPHFHVSIKDVKASFSISDCALLKPASIRKREQKVVENWYSDNKELLIKQWNDSRPSDCPVGKIGE